MRINYRKKMCVRREESNTKQGGGQREYRLTKLLVKSHICTAALSSYDVFYTTMLPPFVGAQKLIQAMEYNTADLCCVYLQYVSMALACSVSIYLLRVWLAGFSRAIVAMAVLLDLGQEMGGFPHLAHSDAGQRKVRPVSKQLHTEHLTIPFGIMRSFF